ncbi:hypothetical protein E2R51_09270 [Jeotgalibacillus sp. S-D1]|uniref:hypothetical protein n=1 Tax=Jeotgalibacillus sp. S-D1 TaxID=2552189 RepID=UPI0010598CCE|nr:hypothetical protein [Jeotgalibacillus sp. S-D1]TDL32849.1 hypothetical protein E2R51_09270 [Jeotgalibacillus sp. S-D1]
MTQNDFHFSVRYKDFEYSVSGNESFISHHEAVASTYLTKLMDEDKKKAAPFKITREPSMKPAVQENKEEKTAAPSQPPAAAPEPSSVEHRDIQAFLNGLPLHSEWQYTLAMAFYLFQFKRQPSFTAKSIRKQFRDARHTVPNNIHLSIHTCVKKGYLKESGLAELQKIYEITESGVHYIKNVNTEEKSTTETSINTIGMKARSDRKEELLAFTLEELQLENNPNPTLLERLEDQALSILYLYKKELDFSHLSAQDVYIILHEQFSFTYSPKAVQIALSRSRPKVEKLKYDGQMHYQLTKLGMDYMENLKRKQLNNKE